MQQFLREHHQPIAAAIAVLCAFVVVQPAVFAASVPGTGSSNGSPCPGNQVLLNPTDSKSCGCPPGSTFTTSDTKNCCPVSQLRIENGESSCGQQSGCSSTESGSALQCLLTKYINPLMAVLSALVGVVVAGAIIYGGIEFTSSGGDPQRAASGKKHITNALIGLAAYLFLYTFLQFILPGGLLNQ